MQSTLSRGWALWAHNQPGQWGWPWASSRRPSACTLALVPRPTLPINGAKTSNLPPACRAQHVLVVTRGFESQTDPLNANDLEATVQVRAAHNMSCLPGVQLPRPAPMAGLATGFERRPLRSSHWAPLNRAGAPPFPAHQCCAQVLRAFPAGAVAFYNCGEHSGRSQPHKHLQIVPLPFDDRQPPEPAIQAVVDAACRGAAPLEVVELRALPFRAYAARLDGG